MDLWDKHLSFLFIFAMYIVYVNKKGTQLNLETSVHPGLRAYPKYNPEPAVASVPVLLADLGKDGKGKEKKRK